MVPGQTDPVLIFGGGYDTNKDSTGVATADSMGRAIFVVNAVTGSLIRSLTHDDLDHGIAAPVNALDSDGDGYSDRVYAADTGGNVWRVDMHTTTPADWKIRRLADFNGGATDSDRRFFNQPDVVGEPSYYAVLLGSGDRTNPLATDVTNRFYAIFDKRIYPYYDEDPVDCNDNPDFRCVMPLDETDLYDATANLIQDGDDAQRTSALSALYSKHGWYITLENTGESALAASTTIKGKTFFTTYTPHENNADLCVPGAGQSRLYALSMYNGTAIFDFDNSGGDLTKNDRSIELGNMILDTPSIYVDDHGNIRLFFPAGGTGGVEHDQISSEGGGGDPDEKAGVPSGTFWYMKDE
jgi:type IV pilus assembly protein PilY1